MDPNLVQRRLAACCLLLCSPMLLYLLLNLSYGLTY